MTKRILLAALICAPMAANAGPAFEQLRMAAGAASGGSLERQ